jgi:glycosyltransferase involved in cell wall biosynthesis
MNKLISVIIPTFNRGDLLGETLNSIQNQSYKNWECIVIDDNSTDGTLKLMNTFIQNDNRFRYYNKPSTKLKGPNSSRNYGFEKANGDFIYFFDSDDFLKPNALESYVDGFQENTDGVLAHVERVHKKSGELIDINKIQSDNLIEDYFTYKVCYFVCGTLWRKSFLDKQVELFDETLGNHDEWDFNLRMIYTHPTIVRLDKVLVTYYQYEDSFKKEIQKGNDSELNSAFQARLKHLDILRKIDANNDQIYTKHIADYYKKALRNKLLWNQSNWFTYFESASASYIKSSNYLPILKMSVGIIFYKLFGKGYSFFE